MRYNLDLTLFDNRRLLLGATVICVLALLLVIKTGYAYHRDSMEELSNYEEALSISSKILSRGTEVENFIALGTERLAELEQGFLDADKPSIGAARLQEAVKKIALRNKISIRSEKSNNFKEAGHYIKIPVEFHFTSELMQLNRLLYDIEASELLIGVRAINIKSPERNKRAKLDITLVVEGVIRRTGD
jgi:Tfp pilus assembly protein PilO